MKNILIIHHGVGYGGGLIALLGLIKELQKNYKVTVYCIFKSEAIEYIKETGVEVLFPKNKIFYKYFYSILLHSTADYFNFFKYILKIYSLVVYLVNKYIFSKFEFYHIIEKFDLIYLNSTFISDWAYFPKKSGKKVVIHVREPLKNNPYSLFYNLIRNNINSNCDWIIAITNDNAKRVNLLDKTTVVYDPIVNKRLNDKQELKVPINNEYKYFVYLGGSSRIKGFEQMVEALKYLNNNIRIFFLGEYDHKLNSIKQYIKVLLDPYQLKKIRLYKKIKESPNIILIGKTHDVFYYYKNSIATISPFSKPHASLPIIESFSVAVPVIVSDIDGMDEFVSEGTNGMFFKNNNSLHLSSRINQMSSLPEQEYLKYKANSRETYKFITENRKSITEIIEKL